MKVDTKTEVRADKSTHSKLAMLYLPDYAKLTADKKLVVIATVSRDNAPAVARMSHIVFPFQ